MSIKILYLKQCEIAVVLAFWLIGLVPAFASTTNYAASRPVTVSTTHSSYVGSNAVDSIVSDPSRWLSLNNQSTNWLVIELDGSVTLAEAHIYSGYQSEVGSPIEHIQIQAWSGSSWTHIPGGSITGNMEFAIKISFASPVTTSKIRMISTDADYCRLREITLWGEDVPLYTGVSGLEVPEVPELPIRVNQIGYQIGAPMRFTAPTISNETPYTITAADDIHVVWTGMLTNGAADFSEFAPTSSGPYVIRIAPPGENPGISDSFLVMTNLIETKMLPPAVAFMVDARSAVGTHPSAFGGTPWRDGAYYDFSPPSLIYLWLNDRETMRDLPRYTDYAAEKAMVLDPSFDTTYQLLTEGEGFVEALRSYYTNSPALLQPDAPDVLECLYFGLGVTLERPSTLDWSGDERPRQIHSQTVEWFAYFLYAWPELRNWFPDSFYQRARDFAFAEWGVSSGLGDGLASNDDPSCFDIDPAWDTSTYGMLDKHPYKGRHAPGHSILPNLMMWQVALREGRSDATNYLHAAQTQTQWVIDNIDWNDPRTTKGQRMSEHKTMPGLTFFLKNFPAEAPSGLEAKIQAWVDIMIARSDNMWDYRRYELSDFDRDGLEDWAIPKGSANWNEPGNLAGFPACALSAASVIGNSSQKQRLREISWAAIDCLFGRNPLRAASPSRPWTLDNGQPAGFPDVDNAWPHQYTGAAAFLENARGSLTSAPGTEVYPFNPEGALRYSEGWVNFNSAWNMGLAFLQADLKGGEALAVHLPIVISEIFADPAGAPLAEYIELYNPTPYAARLSGLTVNSGVSYVFPTNTVTMLPAGGRCLLVRDETAFIATFGTGLPVVGTYSGDLADEGELLELGDITGNTFYSVDYSGLELHSGYAMVFTGNETLISDSMWRPSAFEGGSPGTHDSVSLIYEPLGDADSDGIANLMHHATAGLDHAYESPYISRIDVANETYPGLQHFKNLRADDTQITVDWSTNLIDWAAATHVPSKNRPHNDGTTTWYWRAVTPWDVHPALYFKIKAAYTPID